MGEGFGVGTSRQKNRKHHSKDYLNFLVEVLQATGGSHEQQKIVYQILQANLDKLDENLPYHLRYLATTKLCTVEPEKAPWFAACLVDFSILIQEFRLGNLANNIEIAITGYELAVTVFTCEAFPEDWARLQHNMASAYLSRIEGDKAKNLDLAIAAFQAALQVRTREAFPEQWAMTQNNLALAYDDRIRGNRTDNLEQAIICYQNALQFYTREEFPEQWAQIQNNLSLAYWQRLHGDQAENCESAEVLDLSSLTSTSCLLPNFDSQLDFLLQVLDVTPKQSNGDPRVVYPLLQANLDKLDDNLGLLLGNWSTSLLPEVEPRQAQYIAALICNFSRLINNFPLGSKASNLEIAITGFKVSTTVFSRASFPVEWAKIQNNLGTAYGDRIRGNRAENLEQEIGYYEAALQIYTRKAFPEQWAMTQNNLGTAYGYRIRGDQLENLEGAITAYESALQVYTREVFPEQWAKIQNNLATAYLFQVRNGGDPVENIEKMISALESTLQIRTRKALPEQWAATQENLGIAYLFRIRGDWSHNQEKAIEAFEETLQVRTREAFPEMWAQTHTNLGNAYISRICGDPAVNLEQAVNAYKSALQVFTREEFPEKWAMAQTNLGNAYRNRGQIAEAIKCCQSALAIYKPSAFPLECLGTGRNLGELTFATGQWEESIQGYEVAIEAVETRRRWSTSESRRQEILAESIDVYENMVQACINAGKLDKALEYSERSRSKRLVDLMASNDLYSGGEISPEVKELLQQYEALQQQIDQERFQNNSSNSRELMGVGSGTKDRAAFQAYNEAIAFLEAQKQQIWEQLRRLDPVLAGEIQVSAPDFAAMQKLIDQPTTAILSFYSTSNDTHIFVLRQNQITLHTCYGQGIETLQSWISQNWLKAYTVDNNTWKAQISKFLQELAQRLQISELIFQHLEGIAELIVVPHLLLHQLPLAALPIGIGQYLGDKFLIRYTPSCQILEFCTERGEVGDKLSYGIIENATEDLFFASFESEQIAQLFNIPKSDRLKGRIQCTKSNYRQLASRVQVLHSCHHAQSRLDQPLESVLQLADETITLGELLTPGWRLRNLCDVFLSCCETGLGLPESLTDDILSFSTGFLCAGARSVVSSLWSVDDFATAVFSIFYYQYRYQGKSRPESLRQAQIKLRELTKEELLKREDIKELSRQAEAGRKKAKSKRCQYQPNSEDYLKWDREYKKYASVTNQIHAVKDSPDECPFSQPCYWAAFTCQGLR